MITKQETDELNALEKKLNEIGLSREEADKLQDLLDKYFSQYSE